ncbi:MAG: DUF2189 domain-containing protein [Thalassospira sp.]|uniref:DUF2189 domain-containing protein n=1 Tax=Thalassospira sp. TaxID=1912094 RepID=UPI003A8541AC
MTDTTIKTPENAVEPGQHGITVRTITTDQSGAWLQAGWQDFKRTPAIGLAYGALCALAGWLMVLSIFRTGQPYLTLPLAAGFMLLAPLVAVGLYETSRRLEMGENVTLWHSLNGFRRNPGQIGAIGVVLMLFFLAWTRIAMLLFALFHNGTMPSLDVLVWETFFSRDAITFLITGSIIGGGLAIIVFAISVVSIPLLVDRDVDVITAVIISVSAFRKNWKVLIGWAGVIAILSACGMVVFMFGLAITMPLLGFASWHAYRGIIDESQADVARLRRQVP